MPALRMRCLPPGVRDGIMIQLRDAALGVEMHKVVFGVVAALLVAMVAMPAAAQKRTTAVVLLKQGYMLTGSQPSAGFTPSLFLLQKEGSAYLCIPGQPTEVPRQPVEKLTYLANLVRTSPCEELTQ